MNRMNLMIEVQSLVIQSMLSQAKEKLAVKTFNPIHHQRRDKRE